MTHVINMKKILNNSDYQFSRLFFCVIICLLCVRVGYKISHPDNQVDIG
jgi:hypothetical protein